MHEATEQYAHIARPARQITRMTEHLIRSVLSFVKSSDRDIIKECTNIAFIIIKLSKHLDDLRMACNRFNVSDVEAIVVDAVREAERRFPT